MNERALIAGLCAAQVAGMLGYAGVVGQLPELRAAWSLSATEAGWIVGMFHAGYALSAPILLSATDGCDPRRIYLGAACASLAGALLFALAVDGPWTAAFAHLSMGAGLAGTYMPGLRLLSERLGPTLQSRPIAFYTGCYALGTCTSFLFVGSIGQYLGWRWAFGLAALGPALALALVATLVPRTINMTRRDSRFLGPTLLRWKIVLRDWSVISRSIAYAAHNFELFGLWSWVVAYLAFTSAQRPVGVLQIAPTVIAAGLTLLLLPASLAGNELAERFGSRRAIVAIMFASGLLGIAVGSAGPSSLPAWSVLVLLLAYAGLAAADSGALTASVLRRADPTMRGATMAIYSTVGFAGAFAGPIAFGAVLHRFGADTPHAWSAAFAVLGLGGWTGAAALVLLVRVRGENSFPLSDFTKGEPRDE